MTIHVTQDGELEVAHAEAQDEQAAEFLDAYWPERPNAEFVVVDSGRIMIQWQDLDAFTEQAKREGIEVVNVT